jgi:hypothetical protein
MEKGGTEQGERMKKRIYILISLLLKPPLGAWGQSVNLHKSNTNAIGVDTYLTSPLHQNIAKIHAFALILLFVLGLVASYKIYVRWQLGEEEVMPLIVRWWGGIILCFFVIQFLRIYLSKQSFGEYSSPNF